MPPYSSICH